MGSWRHERRTTEFVKAPEISVDIWAVHRTANFLVAFVGSAMKRPSLGDLRHPASSVPKTAEKFLGEAFCIQDSRTGL
jgi:hypothetical protein